jgi:putative hemolysin
MPTELLIVAGLALASALLVSAEWALLTARRPRLRELAADDRGAATALALAEADEVFRRRARALSVTAAILAGHFGVGPLGEALASALARWGVAMPWIDGLGTLAALAAVVVPFLLIGELLPRRLGAARPEALAARIAIPASVLTRVAGPAVDFLDVAARRLLRAFGVTPTSETEVSEDEIRDLVAEGVEAGIIDRHERDMVNRVLDLDERTVESLMQPRSGIVWLDADAPLAENLALMRRSPYSRYPVKRGSEHEVLGILQVKSLAEALARGHARELFQHLAPALFVPESAPALSLLARFRDAEAPLALVVDEFGDIVGMVTPNNLLNAVFGRLAHPIEAGEAPFVQRADGSWLIDGRAAVEDLRELLGLAHLPRDGEEDFHTAAGFVIARLGRIPTTGERLEVEGWLFEVVDLDGARVDKILAERIAEAAGTAR